MPKGVWLHRQRVSRPAYERMMDKVVKTDTCWLFQGAKGQKGHGVVFMKKRHDGTKHLSPAHRVSWEHHFGPIPNGMWALHKCDVPNCVNPSHLFLGTHQDNMDDMWRKGRGLAGSKSPLSKLTESDVLEIRSSTLPLSHFANRYNVCKQLISQVRNRKIWKHV